MPNHPHIIAHRRVNILAHRVLVLRLLDRSEQGLGLGHARGLGRLGKLLLLLSDNPLVLAGTSIVQLHEALGHLEEVLVWLVRGEFNIKNEVTSR